MTRTLSPARSVARPPPSVAAPEAPGNEPPLAAFHRRLGNAEAQDAAAGGAMSPELWGRLAEHDLGADDGPRLMRAARGAGAAEGPRPDAVGGEPLPDAVRVRMEAVYGHDFGHVRLHRGADAHQAARGLDAAAMAVGAHLFFAPGAWAPGTAEGDRRIAHELAHVVQFDQGQVPGDGGVSAPGDGLERGAEGAAAAAVQALGRLDPRGTAVAPPSATPSAGNAQVLCDLYSHTGEALDRYAERLTDLGLRGMDRRSLAPLTGDPHDDALTPTEIETAFTALAEAGSGVARGWNGGQDDLGARTGAGDGDHAYWTPLHYGLELHRLAVRSGATGYGDFVRRRAAMTTLAGAPMRVHPRTVWFVAAAQHGMDEAAGLAKTGDHYAAPAALTGATRRLRRTLHGIARTRLPRRRGREAGSPLDATLPDRYRDARRELAEIERLAELHRSRDAEADAAGEGREEPEAFAAWLLDPARQAAIDGVAEPTDAASAIAAAGALEALLEGAPGRAHGMGAMDAHGTDHAMGFAVDYGTSGESHAENRGVPDVAWPFLFRLMDDSGPPLAGRRPHAIHALSHEERSALSDLVRSPAAAALVERLSADDTAETGTGEAGPSPADRRALRHSVSAAQAHARQALRDVLGTIATIGRGPTASLRDEVAALRARIRGDLRTMGERSPRDLAALLDGYRPALEQLDAHVRDIYTSEGADERAWLDRRAEGEDPGALPRGVRVRRRRGVDAGAAEVAAVTAALARLDEARADRVVTGRLDGTEAEAEGLAEGPAQAQWEHDREAALRERVRTPEFRRWWRGAARTGIYSQPDAYAAGIASVHAHADGGEHFYGGHHWEIADRRIITDDVEYRASLDRDMSRRGPEDIDRIVGILDEWDAGRQALDGDGILGAALEAAAPGWRERRAARRGDTSPEPAE